MKNNTIFTEFLKYASLNVLGMIGLSCYILADTFFISKGFGADGLTALNLSIPIYSFIHGSGLMIGMGGGTRYSISKSQKDAATADRTFSSALLCAAVIAAAFFLIGLIFTEPIVTWLGADDTVYQMCRTYLKVILLFAPMFILNNLLLCFVRNDGAPQLAMAAMLGGSFSNIVLDYIFIFPFQMGIFGAAFATGLSPVISMLILSVYFLKRKNDFHFTGFWAAGNLVRSIFSGGLPFLITEVSSGIVMIVFNTIILGIQGNVGVAAYGVIANLSLVVTSIYTGIAQGIQPILSRHYGTGNHAGVRAILQYALSAMLLVSGMIYLSVFLGAPWIAGAFNSGHNELLQKTAVMGLKLYFTGCAFTGFNIVLSVFFTSTDHPRPAHMISILRGFVVILPMAFSLSFLAGMTGVWCAVPAAELLVGILGAVFYLRLKQNRNRS